MTACVTTPLTAVVLSVFRLNGLLIDWGDGFGLPHRLSSARWQMLGALAMAAGPLSAPQVGAQMGVTRQGAQKQLRLLSEEGLIETLVNPAHKRSPLYCLTAQGRVVHDEIDRRWQQHVRRLVRHFDPADLVTTRRVLETLSALHADATESFRAT